MVVISWLHKKPAVDVDNVQIEMPADLSAPVDDAASAAFEGGLPLPEVPPEDDPGKAVNDALQKSGDQAP